MEEQLKQACKDGKLTADQLERLSKALQRCKQCERAKVAKMADKRLIDPADLRECDKACGGDWKELADVLKACKDGDDLAELLAKCENGEFGCAGDGEPGFMGDGSEPGFMSDNGRRWPDTTTGGPGGRGGRGGGGDPTAMTWSKGVDKAGGGLQGIDPSPRRRRLAEEEPVGGHEHRPAQGGGCRPRFRRRRARVRPVPGPASPALKSFCPNISGP